MSDFAKQFTEMVGKSEPDPTPTEQTEATAPTPAEPSQSPEAAHNDIINALIGRKDDRHRDIVNLLHPRGDEAA